MSGRFAAIDLGSNTVRLMVGETDGSGWKILLRRQRITRLSGSFDSDRGRLDPSSVSRTVQTLAEFIGEARTLGAGRIGLGATGISRKAENAGEVLGALEPGPHLIARVISGEEEARLTLAGALFLAEDKNRPFLLVDVGGTSTEITAYRPKREARWVSLDLGAVALTERYLKGDPPSKEETNRIEAEVRSKLGKARELFLGDEKEVPENLIGTAGTVTTLAAIDMKMEAYDPDRVEGYRMSRRVVETIRRRLASMTLKERRGVPGLERGREDVIIAGASIVLGVMAQFGFRELSVTEGGLLEGLLLDIAEAIE